MNDQAVRAADASTTFERVLILPFFTVWGPPIFRASSRHTLKAVVPQSLTTAKGSWCMHTEGFPVRETSWRVSVPLNGPCLRASLDEVKERLEAVPATCLYDVCHAGMIG